MGRLLLATILLATLLAGCTGLPERPQPARDFALALPAETELPDYPQRGGVLVVEVSAAGPALHTRRMAYRQAPYEVRYYARSAWAATPQDMLRPAVVEALERAELFRTVLPRNGFVSHNQRLDVQLLELIHDYSAKPAQARITLRAQLSDQATGETLGTRRIRASTPIRGEGAEAGVVATNLALEGALQRVVGFVAETLPK